MVVLWRRAQAVRRMPELPRVHQGLVMRMVCGMSTRGAARTAPGALGLDDLNVDENSLAAAYRGPNRMVGDA